MAAVRKLKPFGIMSVANAFSNLFYSGNWAIKKTSPKTIKSAKIGQNAFSKWALRAPTSKCSSRYFSWWDDKAGIRCRTAINATDLEGPAGRVLVLMETGSPRSGARFGTGRLWRYGMWQTLQGSFSAVSKPVFASTYYILI